MNTEMLNNLYQRDSWRLLLHDLFGSNFKAFSKVEDLQVENQTAKSAVQLGEINLASGDVMAVYEVELQDHIQVERNKVAIRNLLRTHWNKYDGAFIASYKQTEHVWRFSFVSETRQYDEEGNYGKVTTAAKRFTYVLGQGESIRTATERFNILAATGRNTTLEDIKGAFNVEKMSKDFFDNYKKQYELFCEYMLSKPSIRQAIFNGDEKAIRDFNKKLLGRIVFLYFIQKKGWLGVPINGEWGDGDTNFLTNLFKKYEFPELFYSNVLTLLFFDTLNKKRENDIVELIKSEKCKIPFLNGGLFEEDNTKHRGIIFPKEQFRNLFIFFNQYNFTIYEDDPNDHTVAVDPEMLGHIFENLLEDNKDKGAFYTPKEIVHYMCQESLIEYLCTTLQIEDEAKEREAITKLIKTKEIDDILKPEISNINNALDKVKICDPAIGSGAFPMGLLHEIFAVKLTLYIFENSSSEGFDAAAVKLNIIQNSIYGVDIEPGAVDIARLRFWLSLIVDEPTPKALPNLDYKIVVGNSLVSKLDDDIINIDWSLNDTSQDLFASDLAKEKAELLEKISHKQKLFFSSDCDKKKLSIDIKTLKIDLLINQLNLMILKQNIPIKPSIENYLNKPKTKFIEDTNKYLQCFGWKDKIKKLEILKTKSDETLHFFDWKLDFPEIMNEQVAGIVGFDIVIANPPYDVYEGNKKDEIEGLLAFEIYQKCKGGKINAYELFLSKSDTLVRYNGINCQIFQNSFLADNSSRGVRSHYLNNQTIIQIDSFPERDNVQKRVFESAKMSVCILLSQKNISNDYLFKLRVHNDRTLINHCNVNFYKSEIIAFDNKNVLIPSLKEEEKNIFNRYYKSKDLISYSDKFECIEGELNMTFHKSYMTNDSKNPLIVKGAQIQRYFVTKTPSQGQIEFVDKIRYLNNYGNSKKSTHFKTKRIALQGISGANDKTRLISTIIDENIFCANSCNYIISKIDNIEISIYTLLGVFNSKLTNWVFRKTSTNSNVNCYEVNELKLPLRLNSNSMLIEEKVKEILKNKLIQNSTEKLERQIDEIVFKLYNLTYEEVLVVCPDFWLSEGLYDLIQID